MRIWKNVELGKAEAEKFRMYLKAEGIRYEPSSCGNLVHFEVFVDEMETEKANAFLDDGCRLFRDTESGKLLTTRELETEFAELKKNGETETEFFFQYMRNCLDKNGTLEEVKQ